MPKKNFDKLQAISLVGQVGYTICIPLLIFIGLGAFADDQFHTGPIFVLTGVILGILVSFYSLYQLLKPFLKKNNG